MPGSGHRAPGSGAHCAKQHYAIGVAARPGRRRRDVIIAPVRIGAPRDPQSLGQRQRTVRFPQERREAGLQTHGLCRPRRGRGPRHRAGFDDPAGREVRRPPGGGAAADLRPHPVECHDGLVPPAEGAPGGGAELLRAGIAAARTAISTCSRRWRPWTAAGPRRAPADRLSREQTLGLIDAEVSALPARQREAFLLRYWEELDTAETALVMGCTEGSVKTHCSRAVHALAKALAAKGLKP